MQPTPSTSKQVCLVAGGAGFLGAWLCVQLIADGATVVCWDDLSSGYQHNLAPLAHERRFHFEPHDITQVRPMPAGVTSIYNLACPASPATYSRHPVRTLTTSVVGTLNLLKGAQACGARFLQASTSEIYGDPQVHPQTESYVGHVNSMGPRACYDEGKRAAETLCHDFRHSHGVDARVARIFNTYGPGMAANDGRVIVNFIVQAVAGQPLTVYGSGHQTRSFCYVTDLIAGLVALMQLAKNPGSAINLGNPEEISVAALAHMVLTRLGSSAGVVHNPLPTDDPSQRRPDITLAKTLLGWAPKVDLKTGLEHTLAYFKQQHKGVVSHGPMRYTQAREPA